MILKFNWLWLSTNEASTLSTMDIKKISTENIVCNWKPEVALYATVKTSVVHHQSNKSEVDNLFKDVGWMSIQIESDKRDLHDTSEKYNRHLILNLCR